MKFLRELAREASHPLAWYIALGIAVLGFVILVCLAGPLSKL